MAKEKYGTFEKYPFILKTFVKLMKNNPLDNILVVDDEPVICRACSMVLSEAGYCVDYCHNGAQGLEKIKTGSYDALLLDMVLPDISGTALLKDAKNTQPGLQVIIMTGHSTVSNAVEAMKLGAFDYLSKPFSDDELLACIKKALELKHISDRNINLKNQVFEKYEFSGIIGEDSNILRIFNKILKVGPTDSIVLIEGESGTGKELFAKAVHSHSKRSSKQFIAIDCSTFSTSLLESELFGHVKGAFTGAGDNRSGIFEMADGGTLFLDEISNLSMDIQGKLLRVIEAHEYKPVGSNQIKKTDVRIIAATNQNLKSMAEDDKFRHDLFYRLNVFPIILPPLRERRGDIPLLAYHFIRSYCRKNKKKIDGFSDGALEMLINFKWPGNVRQLKNVVERLVILSDNKIVNSSYLSGNLELRKTTATENFPKNIKELKALKKEFVENNFSSIERSFLEKALSLENGNITNAAKRVGMQRSNFSTLMKKYNLSTNRGSRL